MSHYPPLRQVETSGMVGDAIRRLPSFHACRPLLTRDEMLRGLS